MTAPCTAPTSAISNWKWKPWRSTSAIPACISTRRYQESDFPEKGFEIQINNTATGEGSYRERKKTGSLYGMRNIYKQFIADDQWFKIHVAVRGKNVQVRLNGMLVVDYTEPTPPVIPAGGEKERFLDHGTFALQCHNDGSFARFRSVRVRPLPDDTPTPGPIAGGRRRLPADHQRGPPQYPDGGFPRPPEGWA